MQVGSLTDLAERQPRFPRSLEAFAPSLARLLDLALRALQLGLGTAHVIACFLPLVLRHWPGAYSPPATLPK